MFWSSGSAGRGLGRLAQPSDGVLVPLSYLLQNIVRSLHNLCSISNKCVPTQVSSHQDTARDDHDLSSLLAREAGRDERPTMGRRFWPGEADTDCRRTVRPENLPLLIYADAAQTSEEPG